LKKTEALQKNNFSSSDFFFAHAWTAHNPHKIQHAGRLGKSAAPGIELPTFKSDVQHANHCATGALLSKKIAFSLSFFPLAAKGWV
jgi:hypothetical protein